MPPNHRLYPACLTIAILTLLYLLPLHHQHPQFETPTTHPDQPPRPRHPHQSPLPPAGSQDTPTLKNLNRDINSNEATPSAERENGKENGRLHVDGGDWDEGGGGGEEEEEEESLLHAVGTSSGEEKTRGDGGGGEQEEPNPFQAVEKSLGNEKTGRGGGGGGGGGGRREEEEENSFETVGEENIAGGGGRRGGGGGGGGGGGEEEESLFEDAEEQKIVSGNDNDVNNDGDDGGDDGDENGPGVCEVTLPLSPCPCERRVKVSLPGCEGGVERKERVEAVVERVKLALGESTCSEWATARGGEQKVVSYSLFGAFPSAYHRGIEVLAGQVRDAYPGWAMRVYHDLDVSERPQRDWLCALACQHTHLDFCHAARLPGGVGDVRGSVGSVWRAAVLGDPLVNLFMLRDADSPILTREVEAVREWLSSGKCYHLMRDSPHHDQAVMAGLWGGCGGWHAEALPRLRRQLFRWAPRRAPLSEDQLAINMLLWPLIRRNHTAHDAYHCEAFPTSRPFPTRRRGRGFVGMRSLRPHHAHDALTDPCPAPCRPPEHRDWLYC
ncbi:uncharacterized protein LOC126986287 [Eriocheir sinensis]|uniref:uncharacterized protein LOC126986287 n=1 Tax=Eriocheir sinensis TaxID=95602 RepID=UPI0021C98CB6|nr:uncharacterized protein LOC126986287 [Eriocheir sinensis]